MILITISQPFIFKNIKINIMLMHLAQTGITDSQSIDYCFHFNK